MISLNKFMIFTLASCLLSSGCSSTAVHRCPAPPIYKPQSKTDFTNRYLNQLPSASVADQANPVSPISDGMLHLGMPRKDQIVIWYRKSSSVDNSATIEVMLDGNTLAKRGVISPENKPSIGRHVKHRVHPTGVIVITGLAPGSQYVISIKGIDADPKQLIAHTAPEATSQAPFSFLAYSCFQPYRYESPFHVALETGAVLAALRSRCESGARGNGPSFALGLGDQIYVDPGAEKQGNMLPLLSGTYSEIVHSEKEEAWAFLDELYRLHFGLMPMDKALSAIPSAMMWDDHDIRDGWGSHGDEHFAEWKDYFLTARGAFMAYQGARNPNFTDFLDSDWLDLVDEPHPLNAPTEKPVPVDFCFDFDHGLASFFVCDGKSSRNFFAVNADNMWSPISLGDVQISRINEWLARLSKSYGESPRVLVFVFPVPLSGTPGVAKDLVYKTDLILADLDDDTRDRVSIKEREVLLGALIKHVKLHPKHRLLLITGDVHYTGIQVLRDFTSGRLLGYEVISSGLAQTKWKHGFRAPAFLNEVARHNEEIGFKITNHGTLSGPCFTEFFIEPPSGDGSDPAPIIRLMCYPGVNPTNWDEAALVDANASAKHPFRPECSYPNAWSLCSTLCKISSLGLSNAWTNSRLGTFLGESLSFHNRRIGPRAAPLQHWFSPAPKPTYP